MENKQPNVVFICSDHHRWDYMGFRDAKHRIITPNLDLLAARGTTVNGAYSNAPICVPSRIALTSGRYPMNTGCFSNRHPVDPHMPTFVQNLRAKGIRTAMIGKFHHHVHVLEADFIANEKDIHQLGFDDVHQTSGKQGCGSIWCECRYARFLRDQGILSEYRSWMGKFGMLPGTMLPNEAWKWSAELTQDAYIAAKACEYIRQARNQEPFYLHVGLVGPHPPFDAPQEYRNLYMDPELPEQIGDDHLDLTRWKAYAACITEVDEMVGRVIRALEEQGMLQNTVIIYTSDHGDCAGDHGFWGKINFYEGAVHVPLILAGPGILAGRVTGALAELIDMGQTVCSLMGCSSHFLDQGKSLVPLIRNETNRHREDVFSEMGSDKMLYDGKYKLMYGDVTQDTRVEYQVAPYHGPGFGRPVHLPPDRISMYDLENDPHERVNLADDPNCSSIVASMKEKLLQRLIANMQTVREDSGSVL